ncbi:HET-domain-containing protein [Lindgomyces ingoldianus]|uniref:HET-domain-containing protein n=1 Tax=Lindgomyces ingoldianus TaxID=673940 RepID=A0ACB6QPZ2_9PLEO|nr:HET-domain-containing protein [Lindgomyces ingoldianus]KAF2469044.1 HET-domain-containing protein [Lindgomyces ingoldianus]
MSTLKSSLIGRFRRRSRGRNSSTPCTLCQDLNVTADDTSAALCIDPVLLQSSQKACTGCQIIFKAVQIANSQRRSIEAIQVQRNDPLQITIQFPSDITEIEVHLQGTPWKAIHVADAAFEPDLPGLQNSIQRIKTWLEECHTHHSKCGSSLDRPLPTRVIDVGSSSRAPRLYVSRQKEIGRYATLSHRWGPPTLGFKRLVTTRKNFKAHCSSIPLNRFPKTFREAIEVVRGLGLQYLWIDSLCITQGDEEDWEHEASRMADVYSNAYITLAADAASHSHCGLFITKATDLTKLELGGHQNQESNSMVSIKFTSTDGNNTDTETKSKNSTHDTAKILNTCYATENYSELHTRAWVLQELVLSTRIIRFGNAELLWECLESSVCQCGHPSASFHNKTSPKKLFAYVLSDPEDHVSWTSFVANYTECELTYGKDRLPALAGVVSRVSSSAETDYIAGMWRTRLPQDLLWYNARGGSNPGVIATVSEIDDPRSPGVGELQKTIAVRIRDHSTASKRLPNTYAPSWSWASVLAPVRWASTRGSATPVDWHVVDVTMEGASNPYGPVAEAKLELKGYVLPATVEHISDHCIVKASIWPGYNDEDHLIVVSTEQANIFSAWLYLDAGIGGVEWRSENFDYFLFPMKMEGEYDWSPRLGVAMVLRKLKENTEPLYMRVGLADIYKWRDKDWKTENEKVTIYVI